MSETPLHHSLAERLRGEILRGTWAAGERLPAERELAARLGAHRGSLREALRRLEQQGLLAIRPGGGATVRGVEHASLDVLRQWIFRDGQADRALLEQLLQVHEMLVVGATRLAVEHGTPEELARARELLAGGAQAGADADDFLDRMEALIDLIAAASHNLVLQAARRAVNPLFDPRFREVRRRMLPAPRILRPALAAVSRAVAERDADAAEQAVRRLIRLNRQRALDALAALPPARPHPEPTGG